MRHHAVLSVGDTSFCQGSRAAAGDDRPFPRRICDTTVAGRKNFVFKSSDV